MRRWWAGHGDDRRAPQLTNRRTRRERFFVVLTALACLIPRAVSARALSTSAVVVDERVPTGPWPAPSQGQLNWTLTERGIPFYAGRRACSGTDADTIAYRFALDGADVSTQQWAVYVASRETGCSYNLVTVNAATRDDSHCAFQLNVRSGMFLPDGPLGRRGWTPTAVTLSMNTCADAASDLWVACGRGPWAPPYTCRPPASQTSQTSQT